MSQAKTMFAWDHVPALLNTSGGYVATYAADFPFSYVLGSFTNNAGTTTYGTVGVNLDAGGSWLSTSPGGAGFLSPNTYGSGHSGWTLPANQWDLTKARSWIGFRYKFSGSWAAGSLPLMIYTSTGSTNQLTLFGQSDIAGLVAGQEYYVEVVIDRVANTRSVWVDNVLVVNAAPITYAIQSTDRIGFGQCITLTASGTAPATIAHNFKDTYLADDPGDGTFVRLGPQLAKPLNMLTASGNGWTASTGTPLSALTTAISTSSPSTPNVASASDGTPLVTTFGSGTDAGAKINGVLLIAGGQRNPGTGTMMRNTLSDAAQPPNTLQANLQFPAGAFQYGRKLAWWPTAPDGGAWTSAKIAACSMSSVASAT